MKYYSEELSIRLKDMLNSVLFHWKKIIVFAVILAILMAAVQGVIYYAETQEELAKTQDSAAMTAQEKYESNKRIYERRIQECEALITKQAKYMDESVLMNIDANNSYIASTHVYIATDYQIMPGMTYQNLDPAAGILAFYKMTITDDVKLADIAQQLGMEMEYLEELMHLSTSNERWLEIHVYHDDAATAEKITNLLLDLIKAETATAKQLMGEHAVEIPLQSVAPYLGDYISNKQTDASEKMTGYQTALSEAELALEKLSAPSSLVVRCIKWASLGGIAGGVLAVLYYAMMFVFSEEVHSADEVRDRTDLKVFGRVANEEYHFDALTRKFRALGGILQSNSDDNYAVIAESIGNFCGTEDTVLVAGCAEGTVAADLAASLRKNTGRVAFEGCDDLLRNAAAVRNLAGYKKAILVAYCGVVTYKDMVRAAEKMNDAGVELAGCIVVE